KVYTAESNNLGIEHLSFDFTDSGCTLRIKTNQGDEIITASSGRWQSGYTSLFDEIWFRGSLPFVASGAWLTDEEYRMVVRLYETPYIYTLTPRFEGDTVTMVVQINVSLISTEPH